MSGPFGETVVLHSRAVTGRDGDGNDVYTPTDTTFEGVTLYPRESVELVQGQNTNIVGLVAVFKSSVAILATDTLTARGKVWEVDGMVGEYHSSLTGHDVTKVNLTWASG